MMNSCDMQLYICRSVEMSERGLRHRVDFSTSRDIYFSMSHSASCVLCILYVKGRLYHFSVKCYANGIGDQVGRASNLRLTGHRFKSWLGTTAYWPRTSYSHLCASVTKCCIIWYGPRCSDALRLRRYVEESTS